MFAIEKREGTLFTTTEKIDGQSATYFLRKVGRKKYEFGVCSRNILLSRPDSSSYWKVAAKLGIEKVLRSIIGGYDRVVLQGEIIGPGIQKNKYKLTDYDFYAFNLIYPDRKFNSQEMRSYLSEFGIKTVPIIHTCVPLRETIADMVEDSKGTSTLLSSQKREGLVWRNFIRNISFKVINPDFLLANDD
jgi:hypothetical protein